MKDNTEYTAAKAKIGSLNTLSGGFVFGKEEAWDKLQMRLEKKPAKIISRRYIAAAAVLLIFVCIMCVNYFASENIAAGTGNETTKDKPAVGNSSKTVSAPLPSTTEITGSNDAAITMESPGIPVSREGQRKIQQSATGKMQGPPAPVSEEQRNDATVPLPEPVAIVKNEMPVIHINDLEKGTFRQETSSVAANTKPAIDLNSIRVVHINDVEREEKQVKQILRENRMTSGHYPFLKPASNYIDLDDYRQSHKSLKNILTPQN